MDSRTFPQLASGAADSTYYPSSAAAAPPAQVRNWKRWQADVKNPLRKVAYYVALIYTFTVFAQLHQLVGMAVGFDTHMLIIIGVPMVLLVLMSEGVQRTVRWRAAQYWVAFSVWMIIALPFSIWKGASLWTVLAWLRVEVLILFVIAGCVLTWKELKRLMVVLAWAAAVDVISGRLIAGQIVGRLELTGTTMSDPNDYAAQLILVLPCLLLVVISSRSLVSRIAAAGILLYGIFLVLLTGSRGGLVAIGAAVLFCLWKLRPGQKVIAAAIVLLLACLATFVLPKQIQLRFSATFKSAESADADPDVERAVESSEARNYLLKKSIWATLSHPLFGIGAGQFSNYEGLTARAAGEHGAWHETHNSYTQISSELGIPALIFFLGATIWTHRLLNKVYREAQKRPRNRENQQIKITAFCLMVSLVGFCVASFFLSLGYRFYMPALSGLAIALYRAAQQRWQSETIVPSPGPTAV
jgi:O-Antigen ligase